MLEDLLGKLRAELTTKRGRGIGVISAFHDGITVGVYDEKGELVKQETSATIELAVNKLKA